MKLQAIKNKNNIKKLPKRDIFKCHIEKKKKVPSFPIEHRKIVKSNLIQILRVNFFLNLELNAAHLACQSSVSIEYTKSSGGTE